MRRKIALAFARLIVLAAIQVFTTTSPAATYLPAEIGAGFEGSLQLRADGYDLSSRSRDIGGASDQFEFGYETRTGDFDVQTRLEGVTITDGFVQAGLMARETLDPNSRFAGTFSSSALLGSFFESRVTTGATSQQVAAPSGFPVNYPEMYLRLKRSGSLFSGFASFDGKEWQQLGTATASLPTQIYLGIALSSVNTNLVATARFRDIRNVANPQTFAYQPAETLGPSNRRTGLVFSEIMYNPAPRADGENLEFVEIFNAESVFVDLTGWRISGGIDYPFPEHFRLQPGQFAVVAADPGAMGRVYGLQNALGPFQGRLNNGGDTLKLLNRAGATRLEVHYDRKEPWPVSPDGTGHSLVLARPSFGEDDSRAWAASAKVGGSPGEIDARLPDAREHVVINEILAGSDSVAPFLELYNASNTSVDLSQCVLTDDAQKPRFRIPAGTILPARGFIAFTPEDLAFALNPAGQTLYFLTPTLDRVVDTLRFGAQENGIAIGRTPDGSPGFSRLASATPAGANAARRIEDVVINELMYHPITGDDADSYVELFNRSSATVDLSGWKLSDGVEFDIPPGTKLAAGGYLVIAKNAARLMATYPHLNNGNTLGNFSGSLSGSGERVALAKRTSLLMTNALNTVVTNLVYTSISEVTYADRGHWPELADGGGSSLELIDPRSDSRLSANWAASDETAKSAWSTVEVTSKVELGSSAYPANRLQILMQGAGECLVDDIELIPANSTNIVMNGDFETPTNTWRFFGNHSQSSITSSAAFAGANGLHLTAPGDGDTANNNVRGNLVRTLPTSGTATLRAKVRWLAGWPEVLFRVRGNWIELPARMQVPLNLGTPGQPNSRRSNNGGPAIHDVAHSPALPRANEAVVVTCRISDPDGVAAPRLMYRVDPGTTLSTLLMRDDGTGGDRLAGDGIYSATLGARSARTLVAFRIQVTDDSAQTATSVFPVGAPARECLILWDDPVPFGTFAHYHLWSTAATESARNSTPDLDNTFRDATLVYGNARIIYNAGFRDKGSPYHNGGGDFAVTVPGDEPLLGVDDRIFASTSNGGNEATNLKGDVAGWIAEQLGIPFLHSHYMRLYRNGSRIRDVMYDMEQPNRYFAKSWFGGGDIKDDLFKIAIWFEFDDANSNFNSTGATLQRFISEGKYKLARYRWNWQLRPSTETANDYSSIFNLAAAANSASDRTKVLPLLADMEEWMRVFGYHRITGNWDSYSYNVGQNMYLYAPLGQRSTLLPWDIDFVLGDGDASTAATLFNASTDSVIQQLFNTPVYRRMLWRCYQDAANGLLLATNFQPQIDARRAALSKNGVTSASASSVTTYLNGRRTYLLSQLRNADAPSLYITSNSGDSFTAFDSTVALTGVAPIAVASLEVNGVPFPITWTSLTNWQITVPLGATTNILQIVGRDLRGQVLTGAVDTISIQYNGPVPEPQDWVAINEINYHSSAPNADFIEIHNRHPSFAFDLSAFRLEGVDFTFPNGTFIQPNGYLVVVEDKAAFAAAYDPLLPVLGPYSGKLQGNGETLRLVKPAAGSDDPLVIDQVRYSNAPPWPATADGFGPTLQLIDAAQDNSRVGNWAATDINDPNRATPGRQNAVRALIDPFPGLWLNEIQPVNTAGIRDDTGEFEPWIELYNSDTSSINLSGLSLSDDPAQPGKWQFPTGTQISPGQFLLVWADGENSNSNGPALHTNFRLGTTNGIILLSRAQGAASAVIDYLAYRVTSPDRSFGAFPDGQGERRRMFYVPTPAAANSGTLPNANVLINEWLAAAQSILRDPADGQFQDWFELYNAGTNAVDLSGYYLTDNFADATQFRIPDGYLIAPGGYKLVWADGEAQQNAPGRDLHVNFSLKADGEEIALFTPDEQLLAGLSFAQQSPNVSEGSYPDGSDSGSVLFSQPTPGAPNVGQFANRPPVIAPISNLTINEGELLSLAVSASDGDRPPQKLSYALVNPPDGASIDAETGQFSWKPSEAQGPGSYPIAVRVADNGIPSRSGSSTFTVSVRELNGAPILSPIDALNVNEGELLSFIARAEDPDQPAQTLTFSLLAAPPGATLDSATGEFQWTPAEEQGPGNYAIVLKVSDSGQPPLSAEQTVTVNVTDFNNPPVLDPIPIQSVSENSLFSLQVSARDPETPPVQLTYSLENAPAGMEIDRLTGRITWMPGESDGPRDYNIVVHASEPGGTPNASTSFLLGVREVNTAPTLQPLADLIVKPGDRIELAAVARDGDLPVQTLSFALSGDVPDGFLMSPASGAMSWNVPPDPRAGTNRLTLKVSDDATPPLSAEQSFNLIVRAPPRVAINEIMHRPAATNAEFIELLNFSATTAVDLSGWRLEGYNLTFPSGIVLTPGSLLCVARNATAFRAAYGAFGELGTILGDASVTIPAEGGLIRLVRPGGPGLPDETIDQVAFSLALPWPQAAAVGGASLQLIDPWKDHRRVPNWSASTASTTNSPVESIPMTAPWKYWESGNPPAVDWNQTALNDSAWSSGGALLYVEGDPLPANKVTPLTLGQTSYYFRNHFTFAGNPDGALLRFNTIIDDGAVFYLNGQEVFRLGMAEGPVLRSTFANRTVGNAAAEGPFEVPAAGLKNGENVLAVEVHQINATSSDVVFGAALQVIALKSSSFTPNAPNSTARETEFVPPVWINEILPNNTAGIQDASGEFAPWIELYNGGDVPVLLNGWALSDDFANLSKWTFPENSTLPPRGFLLVWADADPATVALGQLHAGFRLRPDAGRVALSARQNGSLAIVDYVTYQGLAPNISLALAQDGDPLTRTLLAVPSPAGANSGGSSGAAPTVAIQIDGSSLTLTWRSLSGRAYRVESSDNLSLPEWNAVATGTGDGRIATFSEKLLDGSARFYRVTHP